MLLARQELQPPGFVSYSTSKNYLVALDKKYNDLGMEAVVWHEQRRTILRKSKIPFLIF